MSAKKDYFPTIDEDGLCPVLTWIAFSYLMEENESEEDFTKWSTYISSGWTENNERQVVKVQCDKDEESSSNSGALFAIENTWNLRHDVSWEYTGVYADNL